MRSVFKRLAFALLGSPSVLKRRLDAIKGCDGAITILNLHRVAPNDGSGFRPLDPRIFDDLLSFVNERFSLLTFAALDGPSSKPKMVLSFDDGYKDFIEVAVPIMAKHSVRSNQNVIPGCIETGLPPLNVMAEDFVGKAPKELVRKLVVPGYRIQDDGKGAVSVKLSAFIKNRSIAEQRSLAEVLVPQFRGWHGFRSTPMMTLDEVRQVASFHEIGAHSFDHASMAFETMEYLADDLLACREYLFAKLHQSMDVYALPNGSFANDAQLNMIKDSGVRNTLIVGQNFSAGGYCHNRFNFDASSNNEARFKALGGVTRVPNSKLNRPFLNNRPAL